MKISNAITAVNFLELAKSFFRCNTSIYKVLIESLLAQRPTTNRLDITLLLSCCQQDNRFLCGKNIQLGFEHRKHLLPRSQPR